MTLRFVMGKMHKMELLNLAKFIKKLTAFLEFTC